ncbi:MAG: thioredoxin family protein, partial [Myxococcota bacterium]
ADTEENEAIHERWKTGGALPTILFVDADGNELVGLRGKKVDKAEFLDKYAAPAAERLRSPSAARGGVGADKRTATKVTWLSDEQAAYSQAEASGKGVLIDFYSDWCEPCKDMEETFADPRVAAAITSAYVPLRFDLTEDTEADEARKDKYRVKLLPTVLFLGNDGDEQGRIGTFVEPDDFLDVLSDARS